MLKYLTVAQVSLITRPRAGRLSSSVMNTSKAYEFARKYVVDVNFIRSSFKLRRKSKVKNYFAAKVGHGGGDSSP